MKGGRFDISCEFNIGYGFNIGVGRVVKLVSKGNIGSTVCCYNAGGPGIAVGIIRCIGDAIRFLQIIGSFRTL